MSGRQLRVSQRNLMWLAAVIAVALIAGFAGGPKLGVAAALIMLVISEGIERAARRKRSAPD